MKVRKLLKTVLCLLLCLSMSIPAVDLGVQAEETNLLANGTFEDSNSDGKADGWTYWNGNSTAASSSVGEEGLTITADSSSGKQRLTVYQTATVEAGKTYKLTGRYQVTSTGNGSLEIRYNAGETSNTTIAKHTSATDGWQTIEKEITATGTSLKFEIVVSDGATLTCSVDDMSLVKVEEETTQETYLETLFKNGTFLDLDSDGKADDWTYWNGSSTAASSSVGEDGLTITADSSSGKQRLTVYQTATVEAGKTYKLTGRYQVTSTGNQSLEIRYNAGETSNTTIAKHTSATDGWQTIEKEITATGTSLKFEIVVSDGATLTCSVDDISLVAISGSESNPEVAESNGLIQNYKYVTDDVTSIENWSYYPNTVFTNNNATVAVEDGAITATLNNTSQLNINQTVKLTDTSAYGKYYVVTGKVKTTGLSSNAYLRVQLLNNSYLTANSDYMWNSTKYTGTNDWQDVTVVFPVPATIGTTEIGGFKVEQIIDKGNGTASFKDLKAYVTDYAYDAGNLIINPDYVNSGDLSSITPWTYYPTDVLSNNKVTVAVSENDEFSATLNGSSNIYLYQTVKLDTTDSSNFGVYYKITGEIKTSDLSNNAYLRAQLVNASNSQISASYVWTSEKYKGTNDWTTITMYIPVPASVDTGSTSSVAVKGFKVEQIADKGTGTVTFRNLKAEKTSIVYDEDNILKNPQYLNGTVSDITGWSYSPVGTVGTSYDVTVNGSDNSITFEGNSTTESLTL